jgi:hypothetical protein
MALPSQVTDGGMSHNQAMGSPLGLQLGWLWLKADPKQGELISKAP